MFATYLRQPIDKASTGEMVLDCPFHDCENPTEHFYANVDTGEWHCKRCDESGNARTLVTKLHAQVLPLTTQRHYKYLQDLRKISKDIFQVAEFAYDEEHDRWLVPYFTYRPDKEGFSPFLNNLGMFYPSLDDPKSQFRIHKGASFNTYLYNPGLHYQPPQSETVIICEGEWDTLAYYEAYPDTPHLVLGKPGAGFNKSYLETLTGMTNIHILLDNDTPGLKQTASAIRTIQEHSKLKISTLEWSLVPDAPKDLRDVLIRDKSLTAIEDAIVPYSSEVEPAEGDMPEILTAGYVKDADQFTPIESLKEYFHKVEQLFYLTEETKLAMIGSLAIATSMGLPGEPLWSFLVGPGGSGKTTFIESFGGNNQWFDNLSKVTAESFVSGWLDETGEDASYLLYLINKCLFVKDFTVTLMSPIQEQRKIFGLLTDIYDGHVKIPFGNKQIKEYHNTFFNMVAGVTDIVNSHSSASIGERFLRLDWLGRKQYDTREAARRALLNYGHSTEHKNLMTSYTLGFVKHIRSQEASILVDPGYIDPTLDLAEFVAIVRTKVESNRFEGISYKPRPELPTRLSKQFAKIYTAAKRITQDNELAFRIVRKFALDTAYGFSTEILEYILHHPKAAREEIARGVKTHAQKIYRVISDLCTTGVLEVRTHRSGPRGGQPKKIYEINPKLTSALKMTTMDSTYAKDISLNERSRSTDSDNSVRTRKSASSGTTKRVLTTKSSRRAKGAAPSPKRTPKKSRAR